MATKSVVFYRLLFNKVCLKNFPEIGRFFREFIPKNPAKYQSPEYSLQSLCPQGKAVVT